MAAAARATHGHGKGVCLGMARLRAWTNGVYQGGGERDTCGVRVCVRAWASAVLWQATSGNVGQHSRHARPGNSLLARPPSPPVWHQSHPPVAGLLSLSFILHRCDIHTGVM